MVEIITRESLIYGFMTETQRPATELNTFLAAFDACVSGAKKPAKKKKDAVVHNENTKNVHPRSKMVQVTFGDRIEYYGSMTAAAHALDITLAQLQYAIKHKKLVNGQSVSLKDSDKIFS